MIPTMNLSKKMGRKIISRDPKKTASSFFVLVTRYRAIYLMTVSPIPKSNKEKYAIKEPISTYKPYCVVPRLFTINGVKTNPTILVSAIFT